jgi:uncharacterized protein (DUF433 family)
MTVTFLDLIEIRFVDAFISAGVRWKTLRDAYASTQAALGPHPFSRERFVTDGRRIFQDFAERGSARLDHAFADAVSGQTIFGVALAPYLATLKFNNEDLASEWWPLGKKRRVVLNPARSFGQPIVSREGVPTATLAKAFKADPSITHISRWFEVEERSVRDAIEFEDSLAA